MLWQRGLCVVCCVGECQWSERWFHTCLDYCCLHACTNRFHSPLSSAAQLSTYSAAILIRIHLFVSCVTLLKIVVYLEFPVFSVSVHMAGGSNLVPYNSNNTKTKQQKRCHLGIPEVNWFMVLVWTSSNPKIAECVILWLFRANLGNNVILFPRPIAWENISWWHVTTLPIERASWRAVCVYSGGGWVHSTTRCGKTTQCSTTEIYSSGHKLWVGGVVCRTTDCAPTWPPLRYVYTHHQ